MLRNDPTTLTGALAARRQAMRLARNAAFYLKHPTSGTSHNRWRELLRQRVREARAANYVVIARMRDWRRVEA